MMPVDQVQMIRAFVEEGALSKATKLLLSDGLADSRDPRIEKALRDLHPAAAPHLVASESLPASVPGQIGDDEEGEGRGPSPWARKAIAAINSFAPGSVAGLAVCDLHTSKSSPKSSVPVHRYARPGRAWAARIPSL